MTTREAATSTPVGCLRWATWLPALAWMALIFRMSSVPGSNVPGKYSTLAHFVEYAILAAIVFLPLVRGSRLARAAAVALVVASVYGVTDEFHQSFVPGRVPDVADWAVDTLGAALAVVLLALLIARNRRAARSGRPS